MDKIVKIILAILLALCLLDMPYGYFQFVRFTSMAAFIYLTYDNHLKKNKIETYLFGILALLFQPLFKISLGREIWNVVDVMVAIILILSLFITSKSIADKDEK